MLAFVGLAVEARVLQSQRDGRSELEGEVDLDLPETTRAAELDKDEYSEDALAHHERHGDERANAALGDCGTDALIRLGVRKDQRAAALPDAPRDDAVAGQ